MKGEFTIHWPCLNKDRKTGAGRRTGQQMRNAGGLSGRWVLLSFQKRFHSSDLLVTGSWRKQHYFSPTKSLSSFQQRPTCYSIIVTDILLSTKVQHGEQRRGKQRVQNRGSRKSMGLMSIIMGFFHSSVTCRGHMSSVYLHPLPRLVPRHYPTRHSQEKFT